MGEKRVSALVFFDHFHSCFEELFYDPRRGLEEFLRFIALSEIVDLLAQSVYRCLFTHGVMISLLPYIRMKLQLV